jgi:hypothetical protein
MNKRRVTLNLDEDIVEALAATNGSSMSAAANRALRRALQEEANRAALLRWLDVLDEKYGHATPGEHADNEAFLDRLDGSVQHSGAA